MVDDTNFETVTDSEGRTYKVYNGTAYHPDTPVEVVKILEWARQDGVRLLIRLGDPKTGRDWLEELDSEGYIGRSPGTVKIPLLIYNVRCIGGPALLDHCIVRILTASGKNVLWTHPSYNRPEIQLAPSDMEGYIGVALVDGTVHARFKSERERDMWYRKMTA